MRVTSSTKAAVTAGWPVVQGTGAEGCEKSGGNGGGGEYQHGRVDELAQLFQVGAALDLLVGEEKRNPAAGPHGGGERDEGLEVGM